MSDFQRRHYEAIATSLGLYNADDKLVNGICKLFEKDNPNFSRERFISRVEEWKTDEYE
tara:strand:- start:518 stop:694 length:177 start_codon:yes stop_codon:yes gene_type:complete